jgi:multi-sensor signal transduction histidine kinase (EC 2.7.13.3)
MAQKLESYEEQNIEELTAEKAKLETLVSTIADGALLLDANLQVILVIRRGGGFLDGKAKMRSELISCTFCPRKCSRI